MRADPVYAPADLLRAPSLLSLARVPLALAFPFAARRRGAALAVLAAAGVSDLLDGWLARRTGQCTPLGAVVDSASDKLFVLSVAATLLARGSLAPTSALLLGVRELGEAAIALDIARLGDARALHEEQRASRYGKATTTAQFAAVALAVLGRREHRHLCVLTAALGAIAALDYARRAL